MLSSVGGCGEVSWLGWLLARRHKEACGRSEGWDVTKRTMGKKKNNSGSCASGHGAAEQARQDPCPQAIVRGKCTRSTQRGKGRWVWPQALIRLLPQKAMLGNTAPNSGLSRVETQVHLYFTSLDCLSPSEALLAQMCLTHGRELPVPEPPASPVWAGLAAGGSSGMEERRPKRPAAVI